MGTNSLVPAMFVRTKRVVIHYEDLGDEIGKEIIIHDPQFEEVSFNSSDYKLNDLPLPAKFCQCQ